MTKWLLILLRSLVSLFRTRRDLAFENLMLRQQLAVLKEKGGRPRLSAADRCAYRLIVCVDFAVFLAAPWVLVSKLLPGWRDALHIVRPETVIRWHREGFRRRWARICRSKGRPVLDLRIWELIRRMSQANTLWGAPRIHGKLLKPGIEISQTTVAKYITMNRMPPSQGWRAFLENHASDIIWPRRSSEIPDPRSGSEIQHEFQSESRICWSNGSSDSAGIACGKRLRTNKRQAQVKPN